MTYTWTKSFNRIELDTASKFIEVDQYVSHNGYTYSLKEGEEIKRDDDVTGLTEVFIVGTVYYNEFQDDSTEEIVKDEISEQDYLDLQTQAPTKA